MRWGAQFWIGLWALFTYQLDYFLYPSLLALMSSSAKWDDNTLSFFKIFFFSCGPFLKTLLNLLQYCLCFMFQFSSGEACGILVPDLGSNPHSLLWRAKS